MLALTTAAPAVPHRYVVVISNNAGDRGDERLRFADDDAGSVASVLRQLGGARPEDVLSLPSATAEDVERALDSLGARLAREGGQQDQLVIYVSSHADEGELHLGGSRYPVRKLTEFLDRAHVGTALLVLDACHSGAATRVKGLKPIPGIHVNVELPEVHGRVVISSAGPDEAAQESSSLHGSYFTHHLVVALRGAGDQSHDGVVTLEEAFRYAYAHTLESTYATRGGVQHPSFRMDLHGYGELVLTRPGEARSQVVLDTRVNGAWLLLSTGEDGRLGEFIKEEGPLRLAVAPGRYLLQSRQATGLVQAWVNVPDAGTAYVRDIDLTSHPLELASAKGSPSFDAPGPSAREVAVSLSLGGTVASGALLNHDALGGGSLRLDLSRLFAHAPALTLSAQAAFRGTGVRHALFSEDDAELVVGVGLVRRFGRFRLLGSLLLGGDLIRQANGRDLAESYGLEPELRLSVSLRYQLTSVVGVFAEAYGSGLDARLVGTRSLLFQGGGTVGLSFELH